MPSIVRVDTLDNQTLDIELSNGNLILLNIAPLLHGNGAYTGLSRQKLLPRPQTDGKKIFWANGPYLELEDVFALLERQEGKEEIKEDVKDETKMETSGQ